ncbi:MAG: hypothetical protein ABJL54_14420 [Halioglobus sp.]
MLKCSAFIASSVDGYIATHDVGIDWHPKAIDTPALMEEPRLHRISIAIPSMSYA